MKNRLDFVSNSSSSSFMLDEDGVKECNEKFSSICLEYISVKDYKFAQLLLRDSINAAIQNYCNYLNIKKENLFNRYYPQLDDIVLNYQYLLENIDDNIRKLDKFVLENFGNKSSTGGPILDNLYISPPIDRDSADRRNFYHSVWKGDL